MTKDERIDQLSSRVMELEEQLSKTEKKADRLANDIEGNKRTIAKLKQQLQGAQKRAADAADNAEKYRKCAIESQGWNWLESHENDMDDAGERYLIDEMQELHDIAHNHKCPEHERAR